MRKQLNETKTKCKEYIDMMIDLRDSIIKNVFRNTNESNVKMPISFQNIINNVSGQLNLDTNSVVDITPLEAFELIETYFAIEWILLYERK